jgi:hypothetical protein
MAKEKHWEVPTTFKVHGGSGEDAHHLVEQMVQRMLTEADKKAGLVMIRVHRPSRLRGPSDACALCKES